MTGRINHCYCGCALLLLSIVHIVLIVTINKTADVRIPLIEDMARDW